MAKTLTAGQEAERKKSYVRIVTLIEVDADAPDAAPTTQRYGSRKYTLSGNLYSDALVASNPIETSWSRLRRAGGLAEVAGFTVRMANEEKLSNLIDTFFLENDTMRLYMIFVTGSEVSSDRIQLAQGVIENFPFSLHEFSLQAIDNSSKDFRAIPADIIDQTTYPNAPFDVLGRPVPVVFGQLFYSESSSGANGTNFLAPAVCVDLFLQKYIAGPNLQTNGTPYQWYPSINRVAQINNYTASGGVVTVDSSVRLLNLIPNRPLGSNDVSTWREACKFQVSSGGASVVNGSNLDVSMGGCLKLGSLNSVTMRIYASATGWSYDVKLRGVSKASGAGASGLNSIALTVSDHADDWDFEQYTVEIDATATLLIHGIVLALNFNDQESQSAVISPLSLHQIIAGWKDTASYYRDGGVVSSAGITLTNPVHQLQAILRAKALINLLVAQVNTTGFSAAATARTGWRFDFSLTEQVDINWLNTFCFESGLNLFLTSSGQWTCVAKATGKTVNHAYLSSKDIVVKNQDRLPAEWDYDFRVSRTPMRDVINEVVLRYRLDRSGSRYTRMKAATGHYRVTGTNAVVVRLSDTTGTVSSSGATFQTSGVSVGDAVYVWGHLSYTITAVNSETQVTVSGTEVYDDTGRTYYIGPNIDGRMVRSQVRYKTENPLGTKVGNFASDSGYASDLIGDDATAQLLIDHLATFRAFSRLTVELGTFWTAANVELGDILYLDHPWLPTERRPFLLTTVNGAQTSGDTTIDVATGDAELFQVDDYILVGSEVMKVTGTAGANAITVTRAQFGTVAVAYVGGEQIKRFENKWEVIGLKPEPINGRWRLELEELPLDYTRIGMCVADGYDDYTAATTDEITVSGWATENSGRALESDENSSVSYAI